MMFFDIKRVSSRKTVAEALKRQPAQLARREIVKAGQKHKFTPVFILVHMGSHGDLDEAMAQAQLGQPERGTQKIIILSQQALRNYMPLLPERASLT